MKRVIWTCEVDETDGPVDAVEAAIRAASTMHHCGGEHARFEVQDAHADTCLVDLGAELQDSQRRDRYEELVGARREFYALHIYGDAYPSFHGPFRTQSERDAKAIALRREHGCDDGGIYRVDQTPGRPLEVDTYYNGFLDGDDPGA